MPAAGRCPYAPTTYPATLNTKYGKALQAPMLLRAAWRMCANAA